MPAPDPVDVPPLARPRAGALPAAVGTTRAEATGAGAAAAREASLRHFNADWFVDNGRYRDAQSWTPPIKVRAGLGPPLPLLPGQTTRARRYRVEDVAVGTPVCPWLWSVTVPALFHPGLPAGSVEPENDDLARWEYAYADEWPGAKTSKTALVRRRILSLLDGDLSMLAQIMWDDFWRRRAGQPGGAPAALPPVRDGSGQQQPHAAGAAGRPVGVWEGGPRASEQARHWGDRQVAVIGRAAARGGVVQ
eukprot:TRINITY_DN224_c0_g1_i4.p2 TRINITY_DN224_c0_g1~~TRINITY_DN224_c0_g1_i4.p2  ORF type:complete len:249 (-),score=44.27 TRINITY_DN224_c0_g1_i4:184-930(-)